MRKSFLTSSAVVVLSVGLVSPALAQIGAGSSVGNNTSTTQSPPPVASSQPGQAKPVHHASSARSPAGIAAAQGEVPPPSDYRGGAGSPFSTQASNLNASDRRSDIAPRLPAPDVSGNNPKEYLAAAERALNHGQTGAAQSALEMAETRALDRTVAPDAASNPDSAAMVRHISAALQALGDKDLAGAKSAITMAMNAPVPPPGPATVTIRITQPTMGQAPMTRGY